MPPFKLKLSETLSVRIIIVGIIFLSAPVIFFLWNEFDGLSINTGVNGGKIGQFGDFVGGVVGSIWALAGVILFYVALKEQRKDYLINQKALDSQLKALNLQIKEFKLQRDELAQTREVFKLQSETLEKQQFEATFFNLTGLYEELYNSMELNGKKGPHAINTLKGRLSNRYSNGSGKDLPTPTRMNNAFLSFYSEYDFILGPYFRILLNIYTFLDNSNRPDIDFYVTIITDFLSESELELIFHYGQIAPHEYRVEYLINKYDILRNLNETKVIHKLSKADWPYDSPPFN